MPETAMSRNSSCILVEGKYKLKKKLYSPYYEQMFGQVAIGNSLCDKTYVCSIIFRKYFVYTCCFNVLSN